MKKIIGIVLMLPLALGVLTAIFLESPNVIEFAKMIGNIIFLFILVVMAVTGWNLLKPKPAAQSEKKEEDRHG